MTDVSQTRVLCVGADESHLRARCGVLACNGYQAEAAILLHACQRLREETFDLIVVSDQLLSQNLDLQAALPAGVRTLLITGFIRPEELITAVKVRLEHAVLTMPYKTKTDA